MLRPFFLFLLLFTFYFTPTLRAQQEQVSLRILTVRTEAEATTIRSQLQKGESFEALARERSVDPSAKDGGYMGSFKLTDLRSEFQRALDGLAPGQVSAVTRVGNQFVLLERVSVEEVNWTSAMDAGVQAFRNGRYAEAEPRFREAVQYAETFTGGSDRLEDSLHNLAETYRALKKYAEAEPVYRRYLATRWGGPAAPEVLDCFAALLATAYFRDSQFPQVLRDFEQSVSRGPLGEDLYEAMTTVLFKAELMPEAESLMLRGVRMFPASRNARFHLAQLYRHIGKTQKALETLEELARMKAPEGTDPEVDRLQQSVVYQKIGSIQTERVELDAAESAYRKALEITPNSLEARLGLGDVYLQQSRPEDALAEYNRVAAADAKSVSAHLRIADAYLRLGRFAEASDAARKVLSIDPSHRRAHYILATALVRMDRKEEDGKELELYRKVEADSRSQYDRDRNIASLNRGAAAKLLEGHTEESIEAFIKLTESYPDSTAAYLNLGFVQSKLGRHKPAVETFEKLVRLGMGDNFLVQRNLAQEYRLLGDMESSRQHEVLYLQKIDLALQDAVDSNLD